MSEEIEDLEASELGTKAHWDQAYQDELENFQKHGIVGDVWFGDDIMMKIVSYIDRNDDIRAESSIIDIGCGNGAMLLELAKEGYTNITGIDYSENAIKVAQALFDSENLSAVFKTFDLLQDHQVVVEVPQHDVCLDKGTFDAISLCPDIPQSEARQRYFRNVLKLMKDDGIFILASCNWTEHELKTFATEYFDFVGVIPTPQFHFQGKTGNLISIVIFRKRK